MKRDPVYSAGSSSARLNSPGFNEAAQPTLFSFGYWGSGSATPSLVKAVDTCIVPRACRCRLPFELGDCFVVNTWPFHHDWPVDGDIVVLSLNDGSRTKYVKRVVGVPGDRIELRDSVLIRNGQLVSEPYVHPVASFPAYGRDYGPLEVAPGQVFVLGDYRDNSIDSRKWGTIPINQIQGPVRFIWISFVNGSVRLDRIGKDLHTPR